MKENNQKNKNAHLVNEVTFKNKTTNTVLHSFGAVHKLPNSLLKSSRAVNKYNSKHSPKHVSIWHTKDTQKWQTQNTKDLFFKMMSW